MVSERLGEQTRLAVVAASDTKRTFFEKLRMSPLYSWRYRGTAKDRFLIVPQDLRTADPSFASEMFQGQFGLAGTLVVVDEQCPFDHGFCSHSWQRELNGFGWMRHLRADDDHVARGQALTLILDWIDRSSSMTGIAWETQVVARRVISWLCHAPQVLEETDGEDYDTVLKSMGRQLQFLGDSYKNTDDGEQRLIVLIALVLAGLCLAERENFLTRFVKSFRRELDRQILPDGGHISRNPWTNVELLLDLLPLKQCFVARDQEPPEELIGAIDRMLQMVRFMQLGDGNLGRFNGSAAARTDAISTVLAYEDSSRSESGQALHCGYVRLSNGGTTILIDAGKPPPLPLSGRAHAGCLSFEFCDGVFPVVVNCGSPGPAHEEWALNARATGAHSTVTIENASSSRVHKSNSAARDAGASLLSGPNNVTAEMRRSSKGVEFLGSHDGFEGTFGFLHSRKILFDSSGKKFEGEDHLNRRIALPPGASKKKVRYGVHFHIHPDVRVEREDMTGPVSLVLPDGEAWTFLTNGTQTLFEESMFLADYQGPRQGLQIVVRGSFTDDARVRWAFVKGDLPKQ